MQKPTPEQYAELHKRLMPSMRFLGQLRKRLTHRGFPPADPLYVATDDAFKAMQDLYVCVHYKSVRGGVGKRAGD